MQNNEKNTEKENNLKNTAFFKRLTERLRQKDEIEVRARLSSLFDFFLTAFASYLLGGAKLFFGIYPFCITLLCSDRRRLLAAALGLLLLAITSEISLLFLILMGPALRLPSTNERRKNRETCQQETVVVFAYFLCFDPGRGIFSCDGSGGRFHPPRKLFH